MSAPTDLELMMYFDGELPEPRASEVRAFVEGSAPARQKLDGLSLLGEGVRAHASQPLTGFVDLGDAIMEKVSARASVAPAAPPKASPPRSASEPARARVLPGAGAAPAANDNGRVIFGLAAFAAVAAAALFMWGRSPEPAPPVASTGVELAPLGSLEAAQAATVAEGPSATASQRPSPVAAEEEAPPPSAEVAAVDFGSRNGMVYYVAVANQPTTTTVVWVRDE